MLIFDDNNAQYLIVNGELVSKDTLDSEGGAIALPFEGTVVYEVMRFINGRGIFIEDHFERLQGSVSRIGLKSPIDFNQLCEYALVLMSANEDENCNIKLMTAGENYVIYMSRKFYPGAEYYENGIQTACIHIERDSPNAKIRREDYLSRINEFKKENGIFEALLINKDGYITEGSRSNFFAIRKDSPGIVYTAPTDMVLEGVMRRHVIKICSDAGIKVIYEPVRYSYLDSLDAAFITGTSINVLPIAKIDEIKYNSSGNSTVAELMRAFNELIYKP